MLTRALPTAQPSELPCLLKPLEFLCSIEETTVRDEAVASLNLICKSMSAEQALAALWPPAPPPHPSPYHTDAHDMCV